MIQGLKLGVTGTRNGGTLAQIHTFCQMIESARPSELHQGCCIGADEHMTTAVRTISRQQNFLCRIIGYPGRFAHSPRNTDYESPIAVALCDQVLPPEGHFARNRRIATVADWLIAMPPCKPLPQEGGTAYTVNKMRQFLKPVTIIWPDGTFQALV